MRSWLALTRRTACVRPTVHPFAEDSRPLPRGPSSESVRTGSNSVSQWERCWTWGGRRPCCHGAVEQTLREPGHGPADLAESLVDPVVGAVPVQRARGGIPLRVEFVQVPTQPVDQSGALPDQGLAVIAQPPDLAVGPDLYHYGVIMAGASR